MRSLNAMVVALLMSHAASPNSQQDRTTEDSLKESHTPFETTAQSEASEVTSKVEESVPTDEENRELSADEDPLLNSSVKRDARREEKDTTESERTTGFDIYGSLRVRYRKQGSEAAWEDGGSRIGIDVDQQFLSESFLFARYEAGFNVLNALDSHDNSEEFKDSIFTRLGYVGLDTPSTKTIAGKNWSTYYEVGAFTDRFMSTGGDASGTFNAQTDGGPTGTGRADSTLQTKLSLDFLPYTLFKPFKLNIQVQHGNSVPFGGGADYGTAFGISAVMTTENNFTLGVAYNHAEIDLNANPSLRDVGLTGSAQALLIGTRAFGERWYAGMVIARMEDHETTDAGIYFDGWGSEFYGQYQLFDRLWFVGGYNILEPDSNQPQAGDYRVKYAVAGLRYSFDGFRRMFFANVRIDESRDADGSLEDNIYTVGVKWDYSFQGWHKPN